MTKEEIRKFLDNTKVYVNGKSREIQEKLFSFGYTWGSGDKIVKFTNDPFIFIHKDKCFTHSNDMINFVDNEYTEILADEILSLELTEPSYRPFKNAEECWNEMLKHQPFGWIHNGHKILVLRVEGGHPEPEIVIATSSCDEYNTLAYINTSYAFKHYTFIDGTPFGIKEE